MRPAHESRFPYWLRGSNWIHFPGDVSFVRRWGGVWAMRERDTAGAEWHPGNQFSRHADSLHRRTIDRLSTLTSNLVASDTNGSGDILFVHDRMLKTKILVRSLTNIASEMRNENKSKTQNKSSLRILPPDTFRRSPDDAINTLFSCSYLVSNSAA